jgi:hypothetical protein
MERCVRSVTTSGWVGWSIHQTYHNCNQLKDFLFSNLRPTEGKNSDDNSSVKRIRNSKVIPTLKYERLHYERIKFHSHYPIAWGSPNDVATGFASPSCLPSFIAISLLQYRFKFRVLTVTALALGVRTPSEYWRSNQFVHEDRSVLIASFTIPTWFMGHFRGMAQWTVPTWDCLSSTKKFRAQQNALSPSICFLVCYGSAVFLLWYYIILQNLGHHSFLLSVSFSLRPSIFVVSNNEAVA